MQAENLSHAQTASTKPFLPCCHICCLTGIIKLLQYQKSVSSRDRLFFADQYIRKILYSTLLCSHFFPSNCENFAASEISEGHFVFKFSSLIGRSKKISSLQLESCSNSVNPCKMARSFSYLDIGDEYCSL